MTKEKTYFISGGGTGGHIYPAVTIVQQLLKEQDTKKIFFVGNPDNLEYEIVKHIEGVTFLPVNIKGMPRKASFDFIKWLVKLELATWKALFYIFKYKPDAVFTTGGYVSAPVAFASILTNTPFMIHDCDAHPGLVSRYVAPFAKIVSAAFEKSKEILNSNNIVINGNPIRNSFNQGTKQEARQKLNLRDKLTILAMGGSQGAATINNASVEMAQYLCEARDIQFIVQTGRKNYDEVISYFETYFPHFRENTNLLIQPYFDDMSIPLKAADIVISRAGSLSLSEINACALPSILIPYPYAAADHQRKNAEEMHLKGASFYLEDNQCSSDNLIRVLNELINDSKRLQNMSENAFKLSKPDSSQKIIEQLKSIVK